MDSFFGIQVWQNLEVNVRVFMPVSIIRFYGSVISFTHYLLKISSCIHREHHLMKEGTLIPGRPETKVIFRSTITAFPPILSVQ